MKNICIETADVVIVNPSYVTINLFIYWGDHFYKPKVQFQINIGDI